MSAGSVADPRQELLDLYDRALPQVYGYLLARCGRAAVAEDLTAETFLAAVDSLPSPPPAVELCLAHRGRPAQTRRPLAPPRTRAAGTACRSRTSRSARGPVGRPARRPGARDVLERLGPQHRAVLTLRYLDGLPVPEVAGMLDRTVHATEALLVRARNAFRRAYSAGGSAMTDPFLGPVSNRRRR